MTIRIIFYTALLSTLMLQCGNRPSTEKTSSVTPDGQAVIHIEEGWARPASAGRMSAAYFNIVNPTNSADTLTAVRSDAATNTQIHLSFMNDEGLMAMEEQKLVPVPARSTVEFKQGGLHVMLIQPEKDLNPGDSVRLTLELLNEKEMQVTVPVRSAQN